MASKPALRNRKERRPAHPVRWRVVALETAEFLLVASGFGMLFWAVLEPLSPALSHLAARLSTLLFWVLGRAVQVGSDGAFPVLFVQGAAYPVLLSALCSAALELALVGAVVFATQDRPFFQRALGAATGALLVVWFNAVRIVAAVAFLTPGNETAFAFAHDALFRAFLILFLVGYYALWYTRLSQSAGSVPLSEKAARRNR